MAGRDDIFTYRDETGKTRYADPTLLVDDLYFFAELAGHDYPDLLRRFGATKPARDADGRPVYDEVPVYKDEPILDLEGKPELDELGEPKVQPVPVVVDGQ